MWEWLCLLSTYQVPLLLTQHKDQAQFYSPFTDIEAEAQFVQGHKAGKWSTDLFCLQSPTQVVANKHNYQASPAVSIISHKYLPHWEKQRSIQFTHKKCLVGSRSSTDLMVVHYDQTEAQRPEQCPQIMSLPVALSCDQQLSQVWMLPVCLLKALSSQDRTRLSKINARGQ